MVHSSMIAHWTQDREVLGFTPSGMLCISISKQVLFTPFPGQNCKVDLVGSAQFYIIPYTRHNWYDC